MAQNAAAGVTRSDLRRCSFKCIWMFIKIFHILDPEITVSKCVSVYCLTSLELSNKSKN